MTRADVEPDLFYGYNPEKKVFHQEIELNHDLEPLEISAEDPPIAYLPRGVVAKLGLPFASEQIVEKPSGYASLHYILRLAAPLASRTPWFELQVRTLAQHAWAEVEHLLGYKPDVHVPNHVERELAILASHAAMIDDQFELVRDQLDGIAKRGENIGDDARISAETLPGLIREAGLRISRDWVGPTGKMLHARGVVTAGAFRQLMHARTAAEIGQERHLLRDLVEREYLAGAERRLPADSEVIGTLANLADLVAQPSQLTLARVIGRIGSVMEYDRVWRARRPSASYPPRNFGEPVTRRPPA